MVSESAIDIRFWGTRGSMATPGPNTCQFGGNTSCVEINAAGHLLICDAGTGLRLLGLDWRDRAAPAKSVHLFLSHSHFDHIQGFPFFAPVFVKDVTITVHDPTGTHDLMRQRLLGQLVPEYCPVSTEYLSATIEAQPLMRTLTLGTDLSVATWEQPHPGGSYGYRFESRGRRVVYATDCELDAQLLNPRPTELTDAESRQFAAAVLNHYRDADLLIADAQYTSDEYKRRVGWGHPRLATVVNLALQARVKRLALFHHDPQRDDQQVTDLVVQARNRVVAAHGTLDVFAAAEGAQISV